MSEDGGGDGGGGGVEDSTGGEDLSTGYGGNSDYGYSESGVYASPGVQANAGVHAFYSNTGAPGSIPVDESGTANRNAQREYNQSIGGGAFTPLPTIQPFKSAYPAGYQPGLDTGKTGPLDRGSSQPKQPAQSMKPKEEEKPKGGGAGSPSQPVITQGPAPQENPYAVERNPYPFSPVVPVAGSGVKKAFFEAQSDLLKAMMPGWLAAGRG